METCEDFCQNLKKAESSSEFVFRFFDDKMSDGKFDEIEDILSELPGYGLLLKHLVYILCVTNCAADKLPKRIEFFNRVKEKAYIEISKDEARKLLHGLGNI